MDEISGISSQQLPYFASIPLIGLVSVLLVILYRRTPSNAARFMLVALWLRCVLAALHVLSFKSSPVGLSYNALASVLVSGVGLLIVRRRSLANPAIIAFVPLLLVMIVSGLVNGAVSPMATGASKVTYLLVLAMATEDAVGDLGPQRIGRLLLVPFAIPLGLQMLSIGLGVAKAGESDGSASYIGGFYHEAAFSVLLMAAMLLICLTPRMQLWLRLSLLLVGAVGIALANYRTAILAILPLVGLTLSLGVTRRFVSEQRAIVAGFMLLFTVAVGTAGFVAAHDRFGDIATVMSEGTNLIQRAELFSDEDRKLLSGRPMIWSWYIYAWEDADPLHKLIGFGPETWGKRFLLYAHNTLVSALYEVGVLGVIAYLIVWLTMLFTAIAARGPGRAELIMAHISFFVVNMATMPMWMIEGMIYYGLLCGFTLGAFRLSRRNGVSGVPALRRPATWLPGRLVTTRTAARPSE